MGRKSTLRTKLPPQILVLVNSLIADNVSIDDITAHLQSLVEPPPSRSAVGRYSKEIKLVSADISKARTIASGIASEIGTKGDTELHRLLIEMFSVLVFKELQLGNDLSKGAIGINLNGMAKAIKTVIDSKQADIRYRESIAKDTIDKIEKISKKAGVSAEAWTWVREELGI